ncbi:MAG: hypothetical protein ACJAZX_000711 [Rickettsiales bacterium]
MIEEILNKVLEFEGVNESRKFADQFSSLYGITIYKDGLDLILTKAKQGNLIFEVKIIKGWNTDEGCCITNQKNFYDKIMSAFVRKLDHKIIIRNFEVSVLSHELAHCVAAESGFDLNKGFRKAVGFDLKNRKPDNVALSAQIKRLMVDALKSYPTTKIPSELFARYFELLSISRDVRSDGNFLTTQVEEFFVNTSKWMKEIFNPHIKSLIDKDIAIFTGDLIVKNGFKAEKKFADNTKSFYKKTDQDGKKSWSNNVNSNFKWQKSWKQHQELEDKK